MAEIEKELCKEPFSKKSKVDPSLSVIMANSSTSAILKENLTKSDKNKMKKVSLPENSLSIYNFNKFSAWILIYC